MNGSAVVLAVARGAPDNPGVKVPPPLLYATAIVGGVLLNGRWPLPIGDGSWPRVVAVILGAACASLAAASIVTFWVARTSILPMRPATTMVLSGPYRLTRNPMYVGMTVLTLAAALFFNTYWPILLLVPVLFLVQRFVILKEEAYLRRRFGAEYDAYCRRVRRWL
jgi:protein-S-isoprenylcysteine O-methyltransferase Ste14